MKNKIPQYFTSISGALESKSPKRENFFLLFHFRKVRENQKMSRDNEARTFFYKTLGTPLPDRHRKWQRPQILLAPPNRPFRSQHPLERRERPQGELAPTLGTTALTY